MTRTVALAAALVALVILTRAPFGAQTLWAHDSALYASALERGFHVDDDPSQQRPHPPGYLFYVASAGVIRAAGAGSNDALVAVSGLASALAAAALFLLARRWMRDRVALIVALAFAANPLVWQYSEIAYPYTTLALASIVIAAACLTARGNGLRAAIAASIVFGVAAGFRQDVLLLFAPLWLWSVAPLGVRRAAVAGGALAAASLLWLVPTAMLSGGAIEYLSALLAQVSFVRATYSIEMRGLPALVTNAAATAWAMAWGMTVMGPLSAAALASAIRRRSRKDEMFFLVWTLPALAVYLALHIGDSGYVLSVLPGLYVLGGRALEALVRAIPARRTVVLAASWSAVIAAPAVAFVFGTLPFGATAIATHDAELLARVAFVREEFAPRSTLILTREDFLLVRYYLPEYRARQYDPEPFTSASRRMRTGRVERIVVFTPGLVPDQLPDVRSAKCRGGIQLVYLDVMPGAVLEFRGERYAIASPAP